MAHEKYVTAAPVSSFFGPNPLACTGSGCVVRPDETCADFADDCASPAVAAANSVQCDGVCTVATCCIERESVD